MHSKAGGTVQVIAARRSEGARNAGGCKRSTARISTSRQPQHDAGVCARTACAPCAPSGSPFGVQQRLVHLHKQQTARGHTQAGLRRSPCAGIDTAAGAAASFSTCKATLGRCLLLGPCAAAAAAAAFRRLLLRLLLCFGCCWGALACSSAHIVGQGAVIAPRAPLGVARIWAEPGQRGRQVAMGGRLGGSMGGRGCEGCSQRVRGRELHL